MKRPGPWGQEKRKHITLLSRDGLTASIIISSLADGSKRRSTHCRAIVVGFSAIFVGVHCACAAAAKRYVHIYSRRKMDRGDDSNRRTTARQLAVLGLLAVVDISAAHTVFVPSPSPSVSAVPSNSTFTTGRPSPSPHPNSGDEPLSEGIISAIVLSLAVFIFLTGTLIILSICWCYRKRSNLDSKGNLRKNQGQDKELGDIEMSPPYPHVSPNKQFHAEGTPLFKRQNANQPTRSNITLDFDVDDFYNGGSMMRGHSGISGLSEDDSMSCPPSPNVSSCHEEDDVERAHHIQAEESSYYNQGRVAHDFSIGEVIPFNIEPTTGIPNLSIEYDSNRSDHHCDHSSGYHSIEDDPRHHQYHRHHRVNKNNPHTSKSRLRSRSPEYPHHRMGRDRPQSFGHQYLFHHTLPNEGQTSLSGAVPIRQSRSDDFGPSGTHGYYLHKHATRNDSTQHLYCTSEAHPPSPPPFQSTSGSNPIEESPLGPPPPPTAAEDPQMMDRLILEAVGCLMHQGNCRIAGCPCREVKKRFQYIIPQTRFRIQRQTVNSTENLQSNTLNHQQQPRLSLSSQNLSRDVHTSTLDSPSSQSGHYVQTDDPSGKLPSRCVSSLNQKEGVSIFCGECPMPECMTLVSTLSDCTSEGETFTDKANDFSLDIPKGAIPEGERLTVDVGVALFGPFQFPEGLRPVSPVFWVCVRDNNKFNFPKPVAVTLPHFLDLENYEDIQSLGLTFLKADHKKNSQGLYNFQQTDGEMDFKPSQTFGTLRTTHFCSLCIACRDRPDVLTRTRFCITSVLPKTATVGQKQIAFFFITFYNLNTCLTKVDEIIAEKKLEHYEKTQVKFNFKRFTKNPGLEMFITQPKHGKIGLMGTQKVRRGITPDCVTAMSWRSLSIVCIAIKKWLSLQSQNK